MLSLYSMTTDSRWATLSDMFRSDFPQNGSSSVRFSAGSHIAYTFDASGRITGTKLIQLPRPSQAPSTGYTKIRERGLYLFISAGAVAGHYVADAPNVTTAIGPFETAIYSPQRIATFPPGTTTGHRFNSQGLPSTSKSITLSRNSDAPFSQSAAFNGARHVLIAAGTMANYWIPATRLRLG